jgi:hypothetical protein
MSLTVVFRQTALRNLARIRSEDKDLFGRIRHAIALLADQPYPKNAVEVPRGRWITMRDYFVDGGVGAQ